MTSSDAAPSITATVGLTEEQQKLINRRQNILRELVTTERAYVVALRTCLETFHVGTMNPPVDIPVSPYCGGISSLPLVLLSHRLLVHPWDHHQLR